MTQRKKLIPILTGNTSNPDFIISASSELSGYPAYKAFDGNNTDANHGFIINTGDSQRYIQISMKDEVHINGLLFNSINNSNIYNSDWDMYTSYNGAIWKKVMSFASPTISNQEKEVLFPKEKCKFIKLVSTSTSSNYAAIGELNFYIADEYYAIKQDNKYYSFNRAQYDTETKLYKEVTAQQILENIDKEGFLAEKQDLFSEVTIGEEIFKPIDKFNTQFQLISVKNNTCYLDGIKSTKEMVVGSADFSIKLADNIDKFIPEYETSEGCTIKLAISIDGGSTWKSTTDNGSTWIDVVDEVNITDPSQSDWGSVRDLIFEHGIDISGLSNINFNTLGQDLSKMRFAYVFNITKYSDKSISTILKWQFDAKGTFKQLSESQATIELTQEQIKITPKENINMLKVNVGTGGSIVINEGSSLNVEEATNEEMTNIVSEVWK